MDSSRGKKSGKPSSGKKRSQKKTTAKRVREERADAFRRGVNSILLVILILIVLFGLYEGWVFLGRPGWPERPSAERAACVELYFHDSAVAYLVPVHRRVMLARNDSLTARAVQEFATGPRDPMLARVYPANIPVPAIKLEKDVAVIDLPEEILDNWSGEDRQQALLNALCMTVVAAGDASKVRILVAGEALQAASEGFALDKPLSAPDFVNLVPDRSLEGEPDWVTAFFLDSTGRYLMPLALQVAPGGHEAEKAIEAVLGAPPSEVDPGPLPVAPEGYRLDRLIIENGLATVDIRVPDTQTAFLGYDINLFRRAVYLTLKKCCQVSDIAVELNGRPIESYGRFGNLVALESIECWNLEAEGSRFEENGAEFEEGSA